MKKKLLVLAVLVCALLVGCGHKEEVSEPPVDIVEYVMTEAEVLVGITKDGKYVKFQDRMSMDWDSSDAMYLEKCAEYHGGSVTDRAFTILVTLNRVVEQQRPIPEVVLEELYEVDGVSQYDFEGIVPSDETHEAMRMIMLDRFDNSYGSMDYIEFYKEKPEDATE